MLTSSEEPVEDTIYCLCPSCGALVPLDHIDVFLTLADLLRGPTLVFECGICSAAWALDHWRVEER